MKVSISIILLSSLFQLFLSSKVSKHSESLKIAFKNISHQVFRKSQRVVIVKDGDKKLKSNSAETEIIDGIKEENIPFRIQDFSNLNVKDLEWKKSSIITLSRKRKEDLFFPYGVYSKDIYDVAASTIYYHISDFTVSDIKRHMQELQLFLKSNELYFVIDETEYLRLLTFDRFSPALCWKFKLIEINRFSKKLNRWLTKEFSIDRVDSLNGCNFVIDFASDSRGEAVKNALQLKGKVESQFHFLTRKIFQALSSQLNFTLIPKKKDQFGKLNLAIIGFERNMEDGSNFRRLSRPFLYQDVFVGVPVGEKFNGFEKLVLPFDTATWFLTNLTFLLSFLTIFILKFTRESVRNFIIGAHVLTPSLNILIIFFGLSQIRMPGRNFARFITMLFIMYSLVIRVAWQGKMFEYLQKDLRKPEMQSIEQLRENNFVFYMDRRSSLFLKESGYDKR